MTSTLDNPHLGSFDLLSLLLHEQSGLSAAEHFSHWHEANEPATPTYEALMPATHPRAGEQYAFHVDLDACSGCKSCVVACHSLNGLLEEETWRKVGTLTSAHSVGLPIVQHVTTACHHCVDPGCLNGCPVKAYEKDPSTGIVKHLDDQCFGCKYCTMMCPYEVPQYSATLGIVRKCDMCSQRMENGQPPACVQACPNQAIRIITVSLSTLERESQAVPTESLVPTAPMNRITLPSTQYATRLSTPSERILASIESGLDAPHEGHLPLVLMLVLTQASVGMWIVLSVLGHWNIPSIQAYCATATLLAFVGVNAALLHLGRPWLAFRSVLGWRTSWLSREAIAFGAFLGSAIGTSGWLLLELWPSMTNLLIATTTALGIVAVGCSCMIYVATQRALWSMTRTLGDFGAATIGLGLIGAAMWSQAGGQWLTLLGVMACMLAVSPKLCDVLRFLHSERGPTTLSARSGRVLARSLYLPWCALWIVLGTQVAMATLGIIVVQTSNFQWWIGCLHVAACFIAQGLHRWLYFASVVYPRMPGASR